MATAHSGRRRHHGSLVKLGNIDQAIGQRKVALDGHELVAHVHELLVTLCQQQDNGGSIGVDVLLARRLERRMHGGFAVEDDLVRRIVGNMLGKLAIKYGVSIDQICRLNKISRTTILQLGRKLRIK